MPAVQLDLTSTDPTLMIVPWHDPVVDAVGFDVRSHYVELFWLNVLGPTATWIVRRLVQELDRYPLGYELDLADTAGALGLGFTAGCNGPFMRALNRCVLFGLAQPYCGALAVRRRVPPVAGRHLSRMPPSLRAAHSEWMRTAAGDGRVDENRRAHLLAAAMVATGDDADVVERQLLSLGVAPGAAIEATTTALARPA